MDTAKAANGFERISFIHEKGRGGIFFEMDFVCVLNKIEILIQDWFSDNNRSLEDCFQIWLTLR